MSKKTTVLCILDGWGIPENKEFSAIEKADTKFFNSLIENYENTELEASGEFVGLPEGQMGNSEVGHTNIGAGRIIFQDLPRINKACRENTLKDNKVLVEVIETLKKNKKSLHLMGLTSDGGVHSNLLHLIALAKIVANNGINVYLHCFLDGRDTPQKSALIYLETLNTELKDFKNIKIATVAGRYYAMDRDNRWDRVEKTYNVIVNGDKNSNINEIEAVENSYKQGINDEFVLPLAVNNYAGIVDNDALIFINFRADRAREITNALANQEFKDFKREKVANFSIVAQMTEYSAEHTKFMKTMYRSENIVNSLGEVLAKENKTQLRIAETEKYAHVTFFFSGGQEDLYENEDRILIKSPGVATYDLQPEMSAKEVNEKLIEAIKSQKYDFVVVNFANTDMVGHTGMMDAAIKACQTIDAELEKLVEVVKSIDGTICITADHGNVEKMFDDKKQQPYTAHTTNKVPFIIVNNDKNKFKITNKNGALCNISPTILKIMDLAQPKEMEAESLI